MNADADRIPDHAELLAAAARIAPHAVRTPVLRSRSIEALAGCEIHFKCENLQRAGAFKFRGAVNAVFSLSNEEAARGVVTQSSGNHGAAVSLACRLRGIRATVVVPHSAPRIKLAAIREFGAEIVPCETSQAARDAVTKDVLARSGASYVHPFNDARVIAGQSTATQELLAETGRLDVVLAPVSGGGLMSGTALAAHAFDPTIRCLGSEPEQARDAHDSLASGQRITGRSTNTICDGLRAELGPLTFRILREHLEGILLVDEQAIIDAMRLVWERLKLVIEPSCAVPLAAVLGNRERFAGQRIGIILSGGNVDLDALPWAMRSGQGA
jgi:threonine dehydratase